MTTPLKTPVGGRGVGEHAVTGSALPLGDPVRPAPPQDILHSLVRELEFGHQNPTSAAALADHLGITERMVGSAVAELIDQGALIGSSCKGGASGYFLIRDEEDLRVGTEHIVSRAKKSFRRVARLRRAAAARFGADVALRLFDLEEVSS